MCDVHCPTQVSHCAVCGSFCVFQGHVAINACVSMLPGAAGTINVFSHGAVGVECLSTRECCAHCHAAWFPLSLHVVVCFSLVCMH